MSPILIYGVFAWNYIGLRFDFAFKEAISKLIDTGKTKFNFNKIKVTGKIFDYVICL